MIRLALIAAVAVAGCWRGDICVVDHPESRAIVQRDIKPANSDIEPGPACHALLSVAGRPSGWPNEDFCYRTSDTSDELDTCLFTMFFAYAKANHDWIRRAVEACADEDEHADR